MAQYKKFCIGMLVELKPRVGHCGHGTVIGTRHLDENNCQTSQRLLIEWQNGELDWCDWDDVREVNKIGLHVVPCAGCGRPTRDYSAKYEDYLCRKCLRGKSEFSRKIQSLLKKGKSF